MLRRTRPDLPRPYRTWGYPVVPILFLLASVGMMVNALWTDPMNTGVTFGIILLGLPVVLCVEDLVDKQKSLATDEHGGNGSVRASHDATLPALGAE